ncbi:MAG: UDP-2,3-diacylglucosamine diphosphatase, partial [Gammaproteobacteria bacterium]
THNGVLYCNDGDWVESCTALIEKHDGGLELLNWTERQSLMKSSHPLAGFDAGISKAASQSVPQS